MKNKTNNKPTLATQIEKIRIDIARTEAAVSILMTMNEENLAADLSVELEEFRDALERHLQLRFGGRRGRDLEGATHG